MDWILARWDELQALVELPHWGAVGFGVVFGLFWTRLGPPLKLYLPWAAIALIAGAALSPVVTTWIQPELHSASQDLLLHIAGEEPFGGNSLLTGAYSAVVGEAAQEVALLFGILLIIAASGSRRDKAATMTIGILTALGYALFESAGLLTPALDAGLSTRLALPLVRELFVVGAHIGAGMILARAWIDGRFIRYFVIATLLQAAVAYEGVLQESGWPATWSVAYLSAVATLAFFWGSSIATGRS